MLLSQDQNSALYQIQGFKPGEIQVNSQWLNHSILIQSESMLPIKADRFETLSPEICHTIFELNPEILLLGTGPGIQIPPASVMATFFERNIGIEFMDSYAASRTYQVLTAEKRSVAALIFIL